MPLFPFVVIVVVAAAAAVVVVAVVVAAIAVASEPGLACVGAFVWQHYKHTGYQVSALGWDLCKLLSTALTEKRIITL